MTKPSSCKPMEQFNVRMIEYWQMFGKEAQKANTSRTQSIQKVLTRGFLTLENWKINN